MKHLKFQVVSQRYLAATTKVDTRMIFHALQQKTKVGVCSKHTDVFALIVFTHALNKIDEKWLIKIEGRKFINVRKNVDISELTL